LLIGLFLGFCKVKPSETGRIMREGTSDVRTVPGIKAPLIIVPSGGVRLA
jgi:hypothetical protein